MALVTLIQQLLDHLVILVERANVRLQSIRLWLAFVTGNDTRAEKATSTR